MKKNLFFLPLLLLLAGCGADEIDSGNGGSGDNLQKYITTTVTVEDAVCTRGTPVNSVLQLTDFGFFCSYSGSALWNIATDVPNKMYNLKMVRNPSTGFWDYADGNLIAWDNVSAADHYTFFAYTPFATTTNGITVTSLATTNGIPTLSYQAPGNVSYQPDLMIARARKDIHPTGHPVNLQMKHALTAIGFEVSGKGEVITGIAVTGISDQAVLMMDAEQPDLWSNHGSLITTYLSTNIYGGSYTANATPHNPLTTDGYLMMIPQILTSDAKVRLTFSNNTNKDFDLTGGPLPTAWEAGKKVTYHINLNPPV